MLGDGKHADRVEETLRQAGPDSYSLVVSQVTAGEAVAVVLRRGPDAERMLRALLDLLADYRAEPDRCMPPLSANVLDIMRDLADVVPGLDIADGIVLAHALADPYSVFLVTRDRVMVNNAEIMHYEKMPREQGRRCTVLRIINPIETSLAFGSR